MVTKTTIAIDELSTIIAIMANFIDILSLIWLNFSDETAKKFYKIEQNSELPRFNPATISLADMHATSAPASLLYSQS